MDKLFEDLKFVRCYLYDFVVFSKTLEDAMYNLKVTFGRFLVNGLKLKVHKRFFTRRQEKLFGHTIDNDGVRTDK